MTQINVDTTYLNHPKTRRLKIYTDEQADIYPIRLWIFCAEYFPKDGRLRGYTGLEIEGILGYRGTAGNLIRALETVGFVEKVDNDYVVHDWKIHAGFVWNYKQAGKKGGKKSGISRRKNESKHPLKRNAKSLQAKPQNASTIALNSIELNKDLIGVPPIAPPSPSAPLDPKNLPPLQKVVMGWKVLTGYALEDKAWDKLNFARCARSAKQLLEFLGSPSDALDCMQDIYEGFTKKNLTVTIETIVKHAATWKAELQEIDPEGRR